MKQILILAILFFSVGAFAQTQTFNTQLKLNSVPISAPTAGEQPLVRGTDNLIKTRTWAEIFASYNATDLNAIHQGGDMFGAPILIGTNDGFDFSIKQNNSVRLKIKNNQETELTGVLRVSDRVAADSGYFNNSIGWAKSEETNNLGTLINSGGFFSGINIQSAPTSDFYHISVEKSTATGSLYNLGGGFSSKFTATSHDNRTYTATQHNGGVYNWKELATTDYATNNFLPLSGTSVGKPLTGNIEIGTPTQSTVFSKLGTAFGLNATSTLIFSQTGAGILKSVDNAQPLNESGVVVSPSSVGINSKHSNGNFANIILRPQLNKIDINTNATSLGLIGDLDLSANNNGSDRRIYPQTGWVKDRLDLKANLAGGNSITGVQSISGDSSRIDITNSGSGNTALNITNTTQNGFASISIKGGPTVQPGEKMLFGQYDDGKMFFFNQGVKPIGFFTGGAEKMTIGANGNVGIGTGVPEGILDVQSTTSGSLPFPRMTEKERLNLSGPVGIHAYQTDGTEGVYVKKSTGWIFAY